MQEVLILFLLNCYLVQFLVPSSAQSITSFTLFSAQSTVFFQSKNLDFLDDESQMMLSTSSRMFEDLQIKHKKSQ